MFLWVSIVHFFLASDKSNNIPSFAHTTVCLFIHLLMDIYFQFVAFINKATMNISIQVFVWM